MIIFSKFTSNKKIYLERNIFFLCACGWFYTIVEPTYSKMEGSYI